MYQHTSSIAYSNQESIQFQQLQQPIVNCDPTMSDSIIYGVEIPNRVFVGGVAFDTTELELKNFFQSFGEIKDAKIITDRNGKSKGYGFITFEREDQAIKLQGMKMIYFKEKKLNIGPAIRKQGGQFPKANQEFLTGQIKVFINSSLSPVYTPSNNDAVGPIIYSLSPRHYISTMPNYHHVDSPRFPTTPRQQILPLAQRDPGHFIYPFTPDVSFQPRSRPFSSQFDQVQIFSAEHAHTRSPSPLHSLQPFHYPNYPIFLPQEQFVSPHDQLDSISNLLNTRTDSTFVKPAHTVSQDITHIPKTFFHSCNGVDQKHTPDNQ